MVQAAARGDAAAPDGRGNFFAIDRRAWARACKLGLNPAVAYLVLARGTGPDQRRTSWSIHAIETYTGISRNRARDAVDALLRAGLVTCDAAGTRPSYTMRPAHEVRGCEGYPPPVLTELEQKLHDQLVAGNTWVPAKGGREWDYSNPRSLAGELVQKGRARALANNHFRAIVYDAEAAARPDWIWLPNALVDAAAAEVAPVELLRQGQDGAALRLLVDLYYSHSLTSDGGVHWRRLRKEFQRHEVGRRGTFVVHGFQAGTNRAWGNAPFVAPHLTGNLVKPEGATEARDSGWEIFWKALTTLETLGLIDFVGHLIEADTDQAEVMHAYAVENGEDVERRVASAAHRAGSALLTPAQRDWAHRQHLWLAPVRAHIADVQMVGLARLRYRPRTGATAAWFGQLAEAVAWIDRYAEVEKSASPAGGTSIVGNPVATSKDLNGHQRSLNDAQRSY